jgi:GDP-L-fucose synthase
MDKNSKIYVAGHRGMVGSAIVRELKRQGYEIAASGIHQHYNA